MSFYHTQFVTVYSVYSVTEVSGIDIANLDSETLCNLLLYGSSNMNMIDNRIIIEATIEYIEKTNRLN